MAVYLLCLSPWSSAHLPKHPARKENRGPLDPCMFRCFCKEVAGGEPKLPLFLSARNLGRKIGGGCLCFFTHWLVFTRRCGGGRAKGPFSFLPSPLAKKEKGQPYDPLFSIWLGWNLSHLAKKENGGPFALSCASLPLQGSTGGEGEYPKGPA